MSTIITAIVIEPGQQSIPARDDVIFISVRPENNFILHSGDEEVSSTINGETNIVTTETNWLAEGVTLRGTINTTVDPILDIVFHSSPLLAAGITIRIIAVSGEIPPHLLLFPPGTIQRTGERIRINFGNFVRQVMTARAINRRPSPN